MPNDYIDHLERNNVSTPIHDSEFRKQKGTASGLATLDENGYLSSSQIDKSTTSATGNPISITGLKSNQLAINPIITFEPIQAGSGDPSPSNIREISGYDKIEVLSCGVNIYNGTAQDGKRWSTTDGSLINANNYRASITPIPVISGQKNYVSVPVFRCYYDKNMTFLSTDSSGSYVVTTPANAVWMHISQDTTRWSSPSTTMVAISNTAIDYVPYVKTTDLSESLGQTVYGLADDVRSGLCTDIWTKIDASTLSWGYNGTQKRYEADLPNAKSIGAGRSNKIVCSKYATDVDAAAGDSWKVFQSGRTVFVYDASQSGTPSGDIAYILANTTIQLTPHEISLLKDYAYVSTNGTNIALDYHNGELASLSDVAQVGETVNNLDNYYGANNSGATQAGAYEDITTGHTTSDTRYVFPYDGYITADSNTAASGNIRVTIYGANDRRIAYINMNITNTYQTQSLYVRKGMKCQIGNVATGGGVQFNPLV